MTNTDEKMMSLVLLNDDHDDICWSLGFGLLLLNREVIVSFSASEWALRVKATDEQALVSCCCKMEIHSELKDLIPKEIMIDPLFMPPKIVIHLHIYGCCKKMHSKDYWNALTKKRKCVLCFCSIYLFFISFLHI